MAPVTRCDEVFTQWRGTEPRGKANTFGTSHDVAGFHPRAHGKDAVVCSPKRGTEPRGKTNTFGTSHDVAGFHPRAHGKDAVVCSPKRGTEPRSKANTFGTSHDVAGFHPMVRQGCRTNQVKTWTHAPTE